MRIVYLNPSGTLGGAERSLLDLMASTRQADPASDLHLVYAAEGPLGDQAARLGVRATLLPMPRELGVLGDSGLKGRNRLRSLWELARQGLSVGPAVWSYANRLERLLQSSQPHLIHSNGIKFHLFTRMVGGRRIPVIWHLRDLIGFRPLMARALRWTSGRAAGAIAISQAVADDARTVLPRLPITVVYNAIDTEFYAPGPTDSRRLDELAGMPPASPGTLRVGLVATFARWKGHDVFLEATAKFLADQPQVPVRFYIIGGPIYQTRGSQFSEEELRIMGRKLGIDAQMSFIAFQEDTASIYRALDIVVHASSQPEPFGRTIVEAMACGKPVIVSRAGGAAELFSEGLDAVGVAHGDSSGLAQAIRQLVGNPDLRRRLGENARRTAVQRFSRDRLGPEVLAVYREVLSQQGTPS